MTGIEEAGASVVDDNSTVTLYFSLALQDGSVIDSNFNKAPATFTMGDGNLLPAFERKIVGLKRGERCSFMMAPEQAFGQYKDANIQQVKKRQFPDDIDPVIGLVVAFNDAAGGAMHGVISAITEAGVTVDFNHPLAGKIIVFEVLVMDITTEHNTIDEAAI
jgi:FKBP-type peptidyl-prolyl cis-trans isomerase SlpA